METPKVTKAELERSINNHKTVTEAAHSIKPHFRTNMKDNFMIYCDSCPGTKTYLYPAPEPLNPDAPPYFFGKQVFGKIARGNSTVYSFEQLRDLLNDTMAVVNSFKIDLSKMAGRNDEQLNNFYIEFSVAGKKVTRKIDYSAEEKSMSISPGLFYSDKLPRNFTDTLTKQLYCISANGNKKLITEKFSYYFLSSEEKKAVIDLYKMYKEQFPGWSDIKIAGEIAGVVQQKYKIVYTEGILDLLNQK